MTLTWITLLVGLFLVLLVAEFFLPSGGLMGVAAAAAFFAAIGSSFMHSTATGITTSTVLLILTPVVVIAMLRVWPRTPIGRRILNRREGEVSEPPPPRRTRRGTPLDELVGRIGKARSNLLPSGIVVVDGHKVDAVSIGMPIDAGEEIFVVAVEAGRVNVRLATDADRASFEPAKPSSPASLEQDLDAL